jgi:hypothetical protein
VLYGENHVVTPKETASEIGGPWPVQSRGATGCFRQTGDRRWRVFGVKLRNRALIGELFLHREDLGEPPGEGVHYPRIEMQAAAAANLLQSLGDRPRFFVGARAGERVEDVGDGGDPADKRNVPAAQPARVAAAVPLLVVGERDDRGALQQLVFMLPDDLVTDGAVAAHDIPLFLVQRARFEQYAVGDADLSHVVHGGRMEDELGLSAGKTVFQGDQLGITAHPDNMQAGLVVLEFRCHAQAPEDLKAGAV